MEIRVVRFLESLGTRMISIGLQGKAVVEMKMCTAKIFYADMDVGVDMLG